MADSAPAEMIRVEVVYATAHQQELIAVEAPAGTTVAEAIELSGVREKFEDIVVDENALGVFGRKIEPEYVLQPGDRVEIYRPLIADPKEIRRKRAKEAISNRQKGL